MCLCFISVHLSTCLFCMFLWFLGHWRILVTRRTSQIYSRRPTQQPASNSSSSRGKECRLSGVLGTGKADPGEEAEMAALLFHGLWRRESRGEREGKWCWWCWVGGVGWRYLVWCQSSQLSGMLRSRRSTPRCFLSPTSTSLQLTTVRHQVFFFQ